MSACKLVHSEVALNFYLGMQIYTFTNFFTVENALHSEVVLVMLVHLDESFVGALLFVGI
jgi:hypothetical protein